MTAAKLIGILFIVFGALGLAYGSFTYTKETHETEVGPMTISVKDKKTVDIPIAAGVGAILLGSFLLLSSKK